MVALQLASSEKMYPNHMVEKGDANTRLVISQTLQWIFCCCSHSTNNGSNLLLQPLLQMTIILAGCLHNRRYFGEIYQFWNKTLRSSVTQLFLFLRWHLIFASSVVEYNYPTARWEFNKEHPLCLSCCEVWPKIKRPEKDNYTVRVFEWSGNQAGKATWFKSHLAMSKSTNDSKQHRWTANVWSLLLLRHGSPQISRLSYQQHSNWKIRQTDRLWRERVEHKQRKDTLTGYSDKGRHIIT